MACRETTCCVPLVPNTAQSYTASCPDGQSGNDVTKTVPAGTYSEATQAAANALALADAQAQAEAALHCCEDCGTPAEPELIAYYGLE